MTRSTDDADANLAADVRSLFPKFEPSRREAVLATLATGFALAVQPVAAETTITTDTQGLEAGEVQIPTTDRTIPAYRAMPKDGGSFPVVLVVQEIFGVHEHIKDVVWLYAAHNPKLKAGVAWYGRLVGEPTVLAPKNPVDVAADLKAPVLGLYGGADQGIPLDAVEAMRAACAKAGKTCEIVVFEGAPHAFHADYRPSYRAEPAKEGWAKLLAWFKQHGVI